MNWWIRGSFFWCHKQINYILWNYSFLLPAPIKKTWNEPHAFHTKLCSKTQIDFVPHPNDCSKYLVCHGFKGFVIQCPEGQLFDKFEKICNPAAEVMCQSEIDERSAKRLVWTQLLSLKELNCWLDVHLYQTFIKQQFSIYISFCSIWFCLVLTRQKIVSLESNQSFL